MDRAGAFGIPVSRAKAYVAGSGHETSATFAGRQAGNFLGIFLSYQQLARDRVFPGPGAFLIRADGTIIGAMSTGAGIGPFVKWPGLSDPMKLVVDGKPTNLEDLAISYALNEPYQPQHGDDAKRWTDAYGSLPTGTGTGLAEVPPAHKQTVLDTAIRLSDAAMAEARRIQTPVAVAVVDRNGDVLQIDRMDGAAPMAPDIAEAVAVTAVNFQGPSERASQPQFRPYPRGRAVQISPARRRLADQERHACRRWHRDRWCRSGSLRRNCCKGCRRAVEASACDLFQ
ncbi:MAG TPA: heme-binding protein [Stellaceae bacterium]|jgi:uncharacterized protein GlcG (DUF336 family)|nr:heme-binding protein [Stellaceae bacterium]